MDPPMWQFPVIPPPPLTMRLPELMDVVVADDCKIRFVAIAWLKIVLPNTCIPPAIFAEVVDVPVTSNFVVRTKADSNPMLAIMFPKLVISFFPTMPSFAVMLPKLVIFFPT